MQMMLISITPQTELNLFIFSSKSAFESRRPAATHITNCCRIGFACSYPCRNDFEVPEVRERGRGTIAVHLRSGNELQIARKRKAVFDSRRANMRRWNLNEAWKRECINRLEWMCPSKSNYEAAVSPDLEKRERFPSADRFRWFQTAVFGTYVTRDEDKSETRAQISM